MSKYNPALARIAHVLFIDMVGFSRETMQAQARLLARLNHTVAQTDAFRDALQEGTVLPVASGDGMALLFFEDLTAPARCAAALDRALRAATDQPPLRVRMGLHSGLVQQQEDIAGQQTVVGDGINTAQRVMDFGDAGHLLLSAQYAGWLAEMEEWAPWLRLLGDGVAKHGQRVSLFTLCGPDWGRSDPPARLLGVASGGDTAPVVTGPVAATASFRLEPVGGAVSPDSPFYVERPCDSEMLAALRANESILLVKGPRQVGKTSLMARGMQWARTSNTTHRRVVMTDFQKLGGAQFASDDTLYRLLAATLSRQLNFSYSFADDWDPVFGANLNLEMFLRALLDAADTPLIWCMDEVDKLFVAPFAGDFFGLVRSWHNSRSTEPDGPWHKLTVVIAYATEAHLFIQDLNQSPFNVGRRLDMEDFTIEQTRDLARRCGDILRGTEDAPALHALLNGQPFLTRKAMDVLATGKYDLPRLLDDAPRPDGPFGDHLARLLVSVSRLPLVADYVRGILAGREITTQHPDTFYRLLAAGVVRQDRAGRVVLRCPLYHRFLEKHLGSIAPS